MPSTTKAILEQGCVFSPTKITFPVGEGLCVKKLKITNRTNQVICYRAYFNDVEYNNSYRVEPKYGVVFPGEKGALTITSTQQRECDDFVKMAVRVTLGPKLGEDGQLPNGFEPKDYWLKKFGERLDGRQTLRVYEKQFVFSFCQSLWERAMAFFGN